MNKLYKIGELIKILDQTANTKENLTSYIEILGKGIYPNKTKTVE